MIIYVDESGAAHTIDQAHEIALKFNALIDAGLIERVREFAKAFKVLINDFVDMVTDVVERLKALGMSWEELLLQPQKENYRSAMQRQQKRKNHGIMKMYAKNKFNGVRPSDYARFSRNRRKG